MANGRQKNQGHNGQSLHHRQVRRTCLHELCFCTAFHLVWGCFKPKYSASKCFALLFYSTGCFDCERAQGRAQKLGEDLRLNNILTFLREQQLMFLHIHETFFYFFSILFILTTVLRPPDDLSKSSCNIGINLCFLCQLWF